MSLQALVNQARDLAVTLCEDTCSIFDIQSVPDGFGGTTLTRVTIASDIPCLVEAQRDMPVAVIAGTAEAVTRGTLYMESTDETQAITPDYEITVDARGDKPARTFIDPRILDNSYEVLLTVSAKLKL